MDVEGKSVLIGSKCTHCTELFFPKKENDFCPQCHEVGLVEVKLSGLGVVQAVTVVNQQPAGGFYKGSVPYAFGIIQLPEGVNIYSLITDCDWEKIKIGQKARMVVEQLYEHEGQKVMTYKFNPIFESN